jgi:hypothetical protein
MYGDFVDRLIFLLFQHSIWTKLEALKSKFEDFTTQNAKICSKIRENIKDDLFCNFPFLLQN